jgi:hypothetical protein
MRRAARTDANQCEIVSHARKLGIEVHIQSGAGDSTPDLTFNGLSVEVKNGRAPKSRQRLRSGQALYIIKNENSYVVMTFDDVLLFVNDRDVLRQKSLKKAVEDYKFHNSKKVKSNDSRF